MAHTYKAARAGAMRAPLRRPCGPEPHRQFLPRRAARDAGEALRRRRIGSRITIDLNRYISREGMARRLQSPWRSRAPDEVVPCPKLRPIRSSRGLCVPSGFRPRGSACRRAIRRVRRAARRARHRTPRRALGPRAPTDRQRPVRVTNNSDDGRADARCRATAQCRTATRREARGRARYAGPNGQPLTPTKPSQPPSQRRRSRASRSRLAVVGEAIAVDATGAAEPSRRRRHRSRSRSAGASPGRRRVTRKPPRRLMRRPPTLRPRSLSPSRRPPRPAEIRGRTDPTADPAGIAPVELQNRCACHSGEPHNRRSTAQPAAAPADRGRRGRGAGQAAASSDATAAGAGEDRAAPAEEPQNAAAAESRRRRMPTRPTTDEISLTGRPQVRAPARPRSDQPAIARTTRDASARR